MSALISQPLMSLWDYHQILLPQYLEDPLLSSDKRALCQMAMELNSKYGLDSELIDAVKVLNAKVDLHCLEPGYYLRFVPLTKVVGEFHIYGVEVTAKNEILIHENIDPADFNEHEDIIFKDQLMALKQQNNVIFRAAKEKKGGTELHTDLVRQYLHNGFSLGRNYNNDRLSFLRTSYGTANSTAMSGQAKHRTGAVFYPSAPKLPKPPKHNALNLTSGSSAMVVPDSSTNKQLNKLLKIFRAKHTELRKGCWYHFFTQSCWSATKQPSTLQDILVHALDDKTTLGYNNRSFQTCVELGWLDADKSLSSSAPEMVQKAYQQLALERAELALKF